MRAGIVIGCFRRASKTGAGEFSGRAGYGHVRFSATKAQAAKIACYYAAAAASLSSAICKTRCQNIRFGKRGKGGGC